MFENNLWTMEPVGRPENTIQGDKYRFTLLTPCLIRMEYREDGKFEDRPTQVVWNRKLWGKRRQSWRNRKNLGWGRWGMPASGGNYVQKRLFSD